MGELLRIPARGDGFALAAELFFPSSPPKAAVLVAGAMGVKASFYAPLAEYMSRRGAAALTVDYRGIGGSRPRRSLRHFHATFHDWGERDLAGALEWLAWRVPEVPLLWVGHSAGAQLMGKQDIVSLLRQNLDQEEQTAQKAEQSMPQLLQKAMQQTGVQG